MTKEVLCLSLMHGHYEGRIRRQEEAIINDADVDDDALIEAIAKRLEPIIPAITVDVWCGQKAIEADTKKNVSAKLKRLLA